MPSSTNNQDAILKRYATITNRKELANATHTAEFQASTCSDHLKLALKLADQKIVDAAWQGAGCIIFSVASDTFIEAIKNVDFKTAQALAKALIDFIETGRDELPPKLQKMRMFANVREHKNRISCATAVAKTLLTISV